MGENTYILISGGSVYQFDIPDGDKIIDHYCFIENNSVAEVFAVGKKFLYKLGTNHRYYPKDLFDIDWNNKDAANIYNNFTEIAGYDGENFIKQNLGKKFKISTLYYRDDKF